MMSDKWLTAAQRATTPVSRRRFTRKHKALKLRTEISTCIACPLSTTRLNAVPFDNDRPKPIAIVGEAPGVVEDKSGVPFVGKSGALLDKMIQSTGNHRSDAVVMNTVACRPPHNRKPTLEEASACRPLFDKQLGFSGAWVVLLMGGSALNQLRPGLRISNARGEPFWMAGRIYIPTYHPAYVLRKPKMRSVTEKDIGLAFKIVNGYSWWKPLFTKPLAKPNDKTTKDLTYALDSQGWAVYDSLRLNDCIVVVKDDVVKVPVKHMSLIRYTVEELVRIGELGRGQSLTTGELNSIHLVKHLGGTIVVR